MDKWEGTRFEGSFDWAGQTILHPAAIVAVLVLGITLIVLPRRYAVLPMLIIACFISSRQRLVVMGCDFDLLRIMVVFGMFRLLLRKEYYPFSWKPIDSAILLWTASSIVFYTIREGTFSALNNRLGYGFDAIGFFFLFRSLIRDWQDVEQIIKGSILISIPVAFFFIIENRTGRNIFSIFGGVPEITKIRDGRLRCQGAFSHPILAGCFWAPLMPLFAAYWWKSAKDRIWAITGIVTTFIIVICCASSTPVMGALAAMLGGLFFPLRRYMRLVRWGVLLSLTALHMMMNAPVWHLIARVSAVGGSTSWHRYNLINKAINHFGDWCFLGISSTRHWGVLDITNHYIIEGLRGGFVTLLLFIVFISLGFRAVGILWRRWAFDQYRCILSWCLGVSLFVHCMQFLGVSYFGQIYIVWYLILAMIGSMEPIRSESLLPVNATSPVLSQKYHGRFSNSGCQRSVVPNV